MYVSVQKSHINGQHNPGHPCDESTGPFQPSAGHPDGYQRGPIIPCQKTDLPQTSTGASEPGFCPGPCREAATSRRQPNAFPSAVPGEAGGAIWPIYQRTISLASVKWCGLRCKHIIFNTLYFSDHSITVAVTLSMTVLSLFSWFQPARQTQGGGEPASKGGYWEPVDKRSPHRVRRELPTDLLSPWG